MLEPGNERVLPLANHDAMDWPNTAHPRFSATLRNSGWLKALEWSGQMIPLLPKAMLGLLVFLAASLILWATMKAVFDGSAIVEPISVSKDFEERGFSGEVISRRILDEIKRISDESRTSKEHAQFDGGGHRELLSTIQVPQTSLSVQTIVAILRDLFDQSETRIGGALTGKPGEDIVLLVRTEHKNARHAKSLPGRDLDDLITKAAVEVLDHIDPYVVASYYYSKNQMPLADRKIDEILATSDASIRAWALNLRGIRLAAQHRYGEANAAYDRAIQLNDRFSVALLNKGNLARQRGDEAGAREAYTRALAVAPRSYLPLNNLGVLLTDLEEFDDALALLREAILRDPTKVYAHAAMGILREKMNDFEQAVVAYERASEIEPSSLYRLTRLGIALYKSKDPLRAEDRFRTALQRLSPADVYSSWGDALLASSNASGAEQKYRQALREAPGNIYALTRLGRSLIVQSDVERAEAVCREAIEADESSAIAHIFCGDVYRALRDHMAEDHYTQALAQQPDNAVVLANLGRYYYATGDPDRGADAFRKAVAITPSDRSLYISWGGLLLGEQDYKGALAVYDKAIHVFSSSAEAYDARSLALQCLEQMADAVKSRSTADAIKKRRAELLGQQDRSPMAMIERFSRLATPVPP